MAIIKLQFRAIDHGRISDRNLVFREIMTKLKVPLLRLKTIQTGYNALIEKKEDADFILVQKGIDLLKIIVIGYHQRLGPNDQFLLGRSTNQ